MAMRKVKRTTKSKTKPHIKTVVARGVVHVRVPPGTLPVVAHHPERSIVEVIPVPRPHGKKSWWDSAADYLFGVETHHD